MSQFKPRHNGLILVTLYDILGVRPKADAEEVRNAYRTLAREYHPDVNPDPKAHERMAQINVAFEVLSDPVRRMEYDATIGQTGHIDPEQTNNARRPTAVHVTMLRRLRDHDTPVYASQFEPFSRRLVTSTFDNELVWWDSELEAVADRVKLEGGVVSAFSVVARDHAVAAGSTEQSLACWTVKNGRVKSWRQTPDHWITAVQPSPDGDNLAVGSNDRFVRVLRAQDGGLRYTGRHDESVTALAWSPDARTLATGSADATVKLWSARTGAETAKLINIRSTVTALAFSPDGRWLAVAAVDLSIRVFHLKDMSLRKTFFGHERPIECLSFHPRSWLLASGSRDGGVGLWNVVQGIGHGRVEASHQPVNTVCFSPDGRTMVTGGLDKLVRIWRLSAGEAS